MESPWGRWHEWYYLKEWAADDGHPVAWSVTLRLTTEVLGGVLLLRMRVNEPRSNHSPPKTHRHRLVYLLRWIIFDVQYIGRPPRASIYLQRTQSQGCRFLKPALFIQKPSPRATQIVCVIDRMHPGSFDVSLGIAVFLFIVKQRCEGEMNPKQLTVLAEVGGNFEGRLEMVNCLLPVNLNARRNPISNDSLTLCI